MAANVSPTFRLARDGCHAHLSDHGAFIGGTVPLLERNALGRLQPRSQAALERLLAIGYGERVDLGWRMTKLASVARALNANDRSLAAIALVQAELPPLPDEARAARMDKANDLAKAYDPNEPRDKRGRWTTGNNIQVAEAAAGTKTDAAGGEHVRRLTYGQALALVHDNNLSSVPDTVILAIMYKESSFNPTSLSPDPNSTARGLMGVTRRALNDALTRSESRDVLKGTSLTDLFDLATNVQVGSAYLQLRVKDFKGDLERALFAYGNGTSDYPNEILEAAHELSNNLADPAMALERILHRRSRR